MKNLCRKFDWFIILIGLYSTNKIFNFFMKCVFLDLETERKNFFFPGQSNFLKPNGGKC